MSSSVKAPFGILAELCGIYYEWKSKGIRSDQPNNVVLYVGSTCVLRKPHKLAGSRISGYYKYGNHKKTS